MNIEIDKLSEEIVKVLQKYSDEVVEAVKEEVRGLAREIRPILKNRSPRSVKRKKNDKYPHYQLTWGIKSRVTEDGVIQSRIYQRTRKKNLTHLLEFGHKLWNGKKPVEAKKHITKTERQTQKLIERRVRRRLEKLNGNR